MSYGETLQIDSNGDLAFSSTNRLVTITGTEKVRQDLRVILQSSKGTFPFASEWGFNFREAVESGDTSVIAALVKSALQRYGYLQEVSSIGVVIGTDRSVTISLQAVTTNGDTVNTEVTA